MKRMNMTPAEYGEYAKRHSPGSPLGRDLIRAFLMGGAICTLGQGLLQAWGSCLSQQDASTATSITLVFLGALLTALGLYDRLAKLGAAGTLVPITGFANAVAAPALEFKSEGLVTGTASKIFTIAGPVIVYGILAGTAYGLVLVLFSLV